MRPQAVSSGNILKEQASDVDFNLEISTTVHGTTHGNNGIATIVPVDYLKTLLDDPALKAPEMLISCNSQVTVIPIA